MGANDIIFREGESLWVMAYGAGMGLLHGYTASLWEVVSAR